MIAIVLGTRPEIIKTAPVIHELARRNHPFLTIHTGQHYTKSLDEIFFDELLLPKPHVNLNIGSRPVVSQLASILVGVGDALLANRPRVVLVQGDTNSVLGGALAAFKLDIPVAHLEAGLRSDDWNMPEEGNRVLAGRVASLHFCPTELQARRLREEGIGRGVHVVGNSIVDATLRFAELARSGSRVLERLGLMGRRYALLTLHRPSNVDSRERLSSLLNGVIAAARELGLSVVFPIHPRTKGRLDAFGLTEELGKNVVLCDALGYFDLLRLLNLAHVALTDSGGIQEEACTLRVPCVTLRANTERPETVDVGANILCDSPDSRALVVAINAVTRQEPVWTNPLGDGHTAERVVDLLTSPSVQLVPSGSQPEKR